MSLTPNLFLNVYSAIDNLLVKTWRDELSINAPNSSLVKIDTWAGLTNTRIGNLEASYEFVDSDKLDGSHASVTPGLAYIPIAGIGGKLATGWIPEKKTIALEVVSWDDLVTQGYGKGFWTVPETLNGYLIKSVDVAIKTVSVAILTCGLYSSTRSFAITSIDPMVASTKFTSYASDVGSTSGVANTYNTLVGKDIWRFDVLSSAGDAKGLQFIIVIEKP